MSAFLVAMALATAFAGGWVVRGWNDVLEDGLREVLARIDEDRRA